MIFRRLTLKGQEEGVGRSSEEEDGIEVEPETKEPGNRA